MSFEQEECDASDKDNPCPFSILPSKKHHLLQRALSRREPVSITSYVLRPHSCTTPMQHQATRVYPLSLCSHSRVKLLHNVEDTQHMTSQMRQLLRNEENAECWGLRTCGLVPLKHIDTSYLTKVKYSRPMLCLKDFSILRIAKQKLHGLCFPN